MKHLALILLATCCICESTLAQQNRQKGDTQQMQSAEKSPTNTSSIDVPAPKTQPPITQPPSRPSSSPSGSDNPGNQQLDETDTSAEDTNQRSRKSSGRQLSTLKPLKTMSGSIPGYMMRAAQANSSQSGSQNQQQSGRTSGGRRSQNGLSSSQQSSLQQIFLNNSMLFDSNGDNLLAANELKDLFLLLISQNNVTNNNYSTVNNFGNVNQSFGRPQYAQTNQTSLLYSSSNNRQSTNSSLSRSQSLAVLLAGSIPAIQGTDLRDATLLFLLLTMQFDTNNDGALDQQELRRFAAALLNNDLNLNQVTQQVQR